MILTGTDGRMVDAEYPIAAVSKLTGVSCHALRVWERRYGYPVPHRSDSGHRRYSHLQVVTLRQVSDLLKTGRSIGEVIVEAREGRLATSEPDDAVVPSITLPSSTAEDCEKKDREEFLQHMLGGRLEEARRIFEEVAARLSPEDLIQRIIAPTLTETGERWFRKRCSVYHERLISGFLRRRLDLLIESVRERQGESRGSILIGSVQGDRHEGGILIVHYLLERQGWRVYNLGTDVPISEYARAVEQIRPDAMAISFVLSRSINKRFRELSSIHGLPIFVGGRSILNYQALARRFGLIPVAGAAEGAVARLESEFKGWQNRRSRQTEAV